jgi:hypothetical protein
MKKAASTIKNLRMEEIHPSETTFDVQRNICRYILEDRIYVPYLLSILILFSHLLQGISNVLFPSGFPTKLCILSSPICTCYMPLPSRLHLIILIMFENIYYASVIPAMRATYPAELFMTTTLIGSSFDT